VAVIGGGDSALDEALVLARHAAQVTVYHRGGALGAQQRLVDQAAAAANIIVVVATVVEEIAGDQAVSGLRVRDLSTGANRAYPFAGVFIYVGLEPNTAFLRGVVNLDPTGHVETDILMRTSLAGVFAAGDIRKNSAALHAAAAGDGATAAHSAFRYLRGRE
jgi:thioredoxin reductase (NADPH)